MSNTNKNECATQTTIFGGQKKIKEEIAFEETKNKSTLLKIIIAALVLAFVALTAMYLDKRDEPVCTAIQSDGCDLKINEVETMIKQQDGLEEQENLVIKEAQFVIDNANTRKEGIAKRKAAMKKQIDLYREAASLNQTKPQE